MPSPSRARSALLATGILLASTAPAAAQDPPPPAPPAAAPPGQPAPSKADAAAPAPPAAPPVRPMSMQPSAGQSFGTPAARAPRRWTAVRIKRPTPAAFPPGMPIANAPSFYRLEEGQTRISVEVSAKVPISEDKAQGRLVFRFRGAHVIERVSGLPLLTGFFSTPVDRAQLVQEGPDADLIVDLREPTAYTSHLIETPRGVVLQIDFPRSASSDRRDADQAAEDARPDVRSRERAHRRTKSQSLGVDRPASKPDNEN